MLKSPASAGGLQVPITRDPEDEETEDEEPEDDDEDKDEAEPATAHQPVRSPAGRKFGPDGLPIGFERKTLQPIYS